MKPTVGSSCTDLLWSRLLLSVSDCPHIFAVSPHSTLMTLLIQPQPRLHSDLTSACSGSRPVRRGSEGSWVNLRLAERHYGVNNAFMGICW